MKILYDSQIFWLQKFGGISRYFDELCKHGKAKFDYIVAGKYSENVYAPDISKMQPFPIKKNFKGKGRLIRFANNCSDKKAIRKDDYDIYHSTYYYVTEYPKNKPTIITAYDFIHELFPKNFPTDRFTVPAKNKSLHNATRIISISQNTKDDLLRLYPDIDESKIDVVHLAIEWKPREKNAQNRFEKPYILFTGQRGGYKNFVTFTKAIAPILTSNDLFLVCTGQPFNEQEKSLFNELKIQARVFSLFAGEDELRTLYENALCFVFPSKYEGFGLPILEAFVSECPAVLANASCFPEIAGVAAEYFDPDNEIDMRKKIADVVQSETLRQELVTKGLEQYKKFTMEKMIERTLNTYNLAIGL